MPVGTGGDRFYASHLEPTGAFVDAVSQALRKGPSDQTLLVLPEGVMINYLARLPNPTPHFSYFAMITSGGREAQIVEELQRRPPDSVVIISRSLFEYGIMRYGAKPDEGKELIDWVTKDYDVEEAKGDNPLDGLGYGVVVLTRKPGSP